MAGVGKLPQLKGTSPSETVASFIDYQGTTAAAILEMRRRDFEVIVKTGLEAA
jgi:pyrroline-5-carboxylate reductase